MSQYTVFIIVNVKRISMCAGDKWEMGKESRENTRGTTSIEGVLWDLSKFILRTLLWTYLICQSCFYLPVSARQNSGSVSLIVAQIT